MRIRNSRPRSRFMISTAVFFRGNSQKYSSMYWISSAPVSSGYCLIRYSKDWLRSFDFVREERVVQSRAADLCRRQRRLVRKVRCQPPLGLDDVDSLSLRVVLQLVAADATDVEVLCLRMREIQTAHRRGRDHRA